MTIESMKEQIAHQIGLETQAGIPKSSLTAIPLTTTQISPTKTWLNPDGKTTNKAKRKADSKEHSSHTEY